MKHWLAIVLCFSFYGSYSQSAETLYKEGLQLKEDKKAREAAGKFMDALALNKDYTEARYELGWCQNDMKAYSGAIENLRVVRKTWNNIPKVFFELGYAFSKYGMPDSALVALRRCLELKPDYSLAFKELGNIYYDRDDYTQALDNFNKYIINAKAAITDYLFWYRKGFMENAAKDFNSARVSLLNSLQYKTDYLNTYLELGFSNSRLKLNDSAIYYFQRAIEVDPKSHIAYNGIGEVYRDNYKDYDKSMEWYRKALTINSKERKANFGIGFCLNAQKKYSEAIPYLKQAIESEATYTAAYVELGFSLYKTAAYTEAINSLNKALELNPKNENARYYAVLVYEVQKNKIMAQEMVDQLKVLNSKYVNELQERVNKMN